MPLIKNFKSTNIWKAFILNSILSAMVIFTAITVKSTFDKYRVSGKSNDKNIQKTTNRKSIILTLLFTFAASFLSYTMMYFVFGFGGGMISTS